MRILLGLLFLATCLGVSDATLKLLKSAPLIYPAKYQTVKYLASPVVIREPLPATYARPAVQFSVYKVPSPSIVTYSGPAVFAQPFVTYDGSPALYYTQPVTAFAEPFSTHVVEEHFYDEKKR